MYLLSQTPAAAALTSATTHKCSSPLKHTLPIPPLFSTRRPPNFSIRTRNSPLFCVSSEATNNNTNNAPPPPSSTSGESSSPPITLVSQDSVPLEGVIQFEKPSFSARIDKWGRVALLAGGDVLALLLFSAIGRFSHGFSIVDIETLRTADPFIAGWVLSAYFLGGYGEDGRGVNGLSQAVIAVAKSWFVGIPTVEQSNIRMDQFLKIKEKQMCILTSWIKKKIQSALVFMLNVYHTWFEWTVTHFNPVHLNTLFKIHQYLFF